MRPKTTALLAFACAVVLAGCGGATSGQERPPASQAPTVSAETSTTDSEASPTEAVQVHCDPNVLVNHVTTCPFAENVFKAYASAYRSNSNPPTVSASSPVTGQTYGMTCTQTGGTVDCFGGHGAETRFPLRAVQLYDGQSTTESSSTSTSESESVEGPGSTSHAEDEQFCSTRHCIGKFDEEQGYVVECSDGSWSHAGGIQGACSYHGGEKGS